MYTDYVNRVSSIPLTLMFTWCMISDTGTADEWLTTRRQRSETRQLTERERHRLAGLVVAVPTRVAKRRDELGATD
jgi:hypothetical protein